MSAIMYKNNIYGAGGSSGGGGGSSTLAGLSDVDISTPTDGQVLTYDDTNDEWVNADPTGGSGVNYSTTEQVIGRWIDGKPLYQKTFSFTLSQNTSKSYKEYAHNISNVDIIFISDASGIVNKTRPNGGTTEEIGIWANATNIIVETGKDRHTYSVTVTFRYTKTTD